MRRLLILVAFAVAGQTAGCEYHNHGITMDAPPRPLRLATPELAYHLSMEDRTRIQSGYDADALERLLQMVRPDMRQEILAHFQVQDGSGRRYGQLVQLHEPQLQEVLEGVWAPMWDEVKATDQQIADNTFEFPGREIAKQRRAAARARRQQ